MRHETRAPSAITRKGWNQRVAAKRDEAGSSAWNPDASFRAAFRDPDVDAVSRLCVTSGLRSEVMVRIGGRWTQRVIHAYQF